jgi:hypothetical protein
MTERIDSYSPSFSLMISIVASQKHPPISNAYGKRLIYLRRGLSYRRTARTCLMVGGSVILVGRDNRINPDPLQRKH